MVCEKLASWIGGPCSIESLLCLLVEKCCLALVDSLVLNPGISGHYKIAPWHCKSVEKIPIALVVSVVLTPCNYGQCSIDHLSVSCDSMNGSQLLNPVSWYQALLAYLPFSCWRPRFLHNYVSSAWSLFPTKIPSQLSLLFLIPFADLGCFTTVTYSWSLFPTQIPSLLSLLCLIPVPDSDSFTNTSPSSAWSLLLTQVPSQLCHLCLIPFVDLHCFMTTSSLPLSLPPDPDHCSAGLSTIC